MTDTGNTKTEKIRELNDALRHGRDPNGRVFITAGIKALGEAFVSDVLRSVHAFDQFNQENDPYGEHDFGAFSVGDRRIFFKIDYYDKALVAGSPDPTDPTVTTRVLTIMLPEEY